MTNLLLSEIWIYPVKSLGGIPLQTAEVKRKGLQYDRRWMLIDSDGVAMTQRVYHEMALFKLSFHDKNINIAFTKEGTTVDATVLRPGDPVTGPICKARVWNDEVDVVVHHPLSEWFSDLLHTSCRWVAFPEEHTRKVDPRYSVNNAQVSLADAYPFLIIGQCSLDDLNQKLKDSVPMNRFRPNFVFTGGAPYAEDNWRDVRIGDLRFVGVKKSDRCILTTVDQDTAQRGTEPLRTLSTYRKVGNEVFFGQNMIGLDEGTVSVGDVIIPG